MSKLKPKTKGTGNKKISRNITLSQSVHDYVVDTGKLPKENRNFSNMAETLILEAKYIRDSNPKS